MKVIPVSAPSRVEHLLRRAPDGPVPVVHRGPHAVYVEVGGWCVGIVDGDAARVPCALRAAGSGVPDTETAHLAGGVLHVDGVPLVVGRFVEVRVPRLVSAGAPVARADQGPEVAALVGAGDGLTPYGDDVLCGWLALHRAKRVETPDVDAEVRRLLPRTTLLSATLLDCAIRGEVLPEFAAYVAALGTAWEAAATEALAAVGGSSGAGLLEGARWALAA